MLVTFKSKAAAEILMYEAHAKPILDLLGKDIERGVITADEAMAWGFSGPMLGSSAYRR